MAVSSLLRTKPLPQHVPWVEKYRPRVLNEVSHQEEVLKILKNVVESGNMPHMLLHGPPGTGKTSSILALANELFGREQIADRVKELNASDDRGIAAVREKIKSWCRFEPRGQAKHPVTGRPLPSWKIVILDEADTMTTDAQSALRRIIEDYSKSTRFAIICNYVHKIIEPLLSRCSVYRFESIPAEVQITRLGYICDQEKLQLTSDKVLEAIHEVSEGDLRRGVTLLQSTSRFYKELDSNTVYEVAGYPPISVASDLLKACRASDSEAEASVKDIHCDGWDTLIILRQLSGLVAQSSLTNVQKARICIYVAERNYAIHQGANAYLNLLAISRMLSSVVAAS